MKKTTILYMFVLLAIVVAIYLCNRVNNEPPEKSVVSKEVNEVREEVEVIDLDDEKSVVSNEVNKVEEEIEVVDLSNEKGTVSSNVGKKKEVEKDLNNLLQQKEQLVDNLDWDINPTGMTDTDSIKSLLIYGEISMSLAFEDSHILRERKENGVIEVLAVKSGSMQSDTNEKVWDKWECVAYVSVPKRNGEFAIENDDIRAVAILKYSYPSNPFWGEPSVEEREQYFDKFIVNIGFITEGVIDEKWLVWEGNYPNVGEITRTLSKGFDINSPEKS